MTKTEIIKRPVENVSDNLKKSAWGAVFESLATIILGIFLIVWPDVVIKVVAYLVGLFFIIKGGYQVVNYFISKGQYDFFNNGLLNGVVSVLVGVALLLIGEDLVNIFRVVIGIFIVYESLVRINTAIKLHDAKISAWRYILILALMMLVLGVFVTFYNGAVVTLVGWMMILAGIVGIVGDVMFIQYLNKIVEFLVGGKKSNEEL